jgi:ligand-binding SRPBCC domain-containing protein
MNYHHSFRVKAPLAEVANFHTHSASMAAITPPPVIVQIHQAPPHLQTGAEMDFTLWLGPVPLHWLARIENVSPHGFVDRQLRGPFQHWAHHHRFVVVDAATTEVVDEIEATLKKHPWWGLMGLGMWISLPLLFAYRGWQTRRLLKNGSKWVGAA